MKRYHRAESISRRIFFILATLLYLSFMLCDFFDSGVLLSSSLKFASIVLCLLMSVITLFFNRKSTDHRIVVGAFGFTVTADIFLLFTNNYLFGVISFCVVQLIYLSRIQLISLFQIQKKVEYEEFPKRKRMLTGAMKDLPIRILKHVLVRVVGAAIIIGIMLIVRVEVDLLLCITIFYFINFVGNLILLGIGMKSEEKEECEVNVKRFFVGMVLFILCDLCVGMYNLTDYIELSGNLYQVIEGIASYGMWGFYLPGQVCIALSTKKK